MLSLSCGCFVLPHIAEKCIEYCEYCFPQFVFVHFNDSLFLCLFLKNYILIELSANKINFNSFVTLKTLTFIC